jgi:hypothetical protein
MRGVILYDTLFAMKKYANQVYFLKSGGTLETLIYYKYKQPLAEMQGKFSPDPGCPFIKLAIFTIRCFVSIVH